MNIMEAVTVSIIKQEHLRFGTMLHLLNQLRKDLAAGTTHIDAQLFELVIEYISCFLDELHHPKEDNYLMPALLKRKPELANAIADIEAEHLLGVELRLELATRLEDYKLNGLSAGMALEAIIDRYVAMEWDHIRKEETIIIPAAIECLSAQDWAPIDKAFSNHDDPLFGDKPLKKFKDLAKKITYLAPAPHGLGGHS
jgi:branched-chain amino acid transport system ATP-binding protein